MDGYMEMEKYYNMTSGGSKYILRLKQISQPFSMRELKSCPMCRQPLLSINRYGHIVRRAWIDQMTKKFVVWANHKFVPLTKKLDKIERDYEKSVQDNEGRSRNTEDVSEVTQLCRLMDRMSFKTVPLTGTQANQNSLISRLCGSYRRMFALQHEIKEFLIKVSEADQPISRIYNLVEDARRRRDIQHDIAFDLPSMLQVRNRLLATILLLRCEYFILQWFISRYASTGAISVEVNFGHNRSECEALIDELQEKQQLSNEVEGCLYWARFAALECRYARDPSTETKHVLIEAAKDKLKQAQDVCNTHPAQTTGLNQQIFDVTQMLIDSAFYAPVTNEDMSRIYAAMTQEFQGTGHWCFCSNEHPFTIGECGMPVLTSRCPQCGATIGGTDHDLADGVTPATELERRFSGDVN